VDAPGGGSTPFAGVVLTGAVVVSAACRPGGRSAITLVGPGEGFGFDALGPGSPTARGPAAPGCVRGFVASRILLIPATSADAAIAQRPAAAAALLQVLTHHAERTERRLIRTLTLPLTDRLLAELRELSVTFGRPVPGGRRIELPLTQDVLADLVGAVRESVNRALRTLAAGGALARTASSYVVLDPPER